MNTNLRSAPPLCRYAGPAIRAVSIGLMLPAPRSRGQPTFLIRSRCGRKLACEGLWRNELSRLASAFSDLDVLQQRPGLVNLGIVVAVNLCAGRADADDILRHVPTFDRDQAKAWMSGA